MSFEALNIGASALYAAQRAAEVTAHNIANSSTPGYTRQQLAVQAAPPAPGTPGMRGTGVTILSIQRMRDQLADVSYRFEAASAGAADARSAVLQRAESVLGPYAQGAPDQLNQFFSAWTQASLTPTDPAARMAVINAGQALASSLNDASTALSQTSDDTYRQIQDDVTQINTLTSQLANLNQQIANAVTANNSPNDLLDQRDQVVDTLVALTGAQVHTSGALQQVSLSVGSAVLVDGVHTTSLAVTRSNGVVSFTAGTSPTPVAPGGEVGAYTRVVNVDLPGYQQHLDAVASGLAQQVNALHAQGYNAVDPTTGGPTGGDFFTGTTAASIAVRISSPGQLALSQSGNPNDGTIALDVAGLSTAPAFTSDPNGSATPVPLAPGTTAAGGFSIGDALRALAGRLGTDSGDAQATATAADSSRDAAAQSRTDANGVNNDQELVDLTKYQNAYEAAARVITVADSMLDTLINHTGVG